MQGHHLVVHVCLLFDDGFFAAAAEEVSSGVVFGYTRGAPAGAYHERNASDVDVGVRRAVAVGAMNVYGGVDGQIVGEIAQSARANV